MKKTLFIAALVIILVCINWLVEASAQMTPEQIKAYKELLKSKNSQNVDETHSYTTPTIFNDDSVLNNASHLRQHRRRTVDSSAAAMRDSMPPADRIITENQRNYSASARVDSQLVLPAGAEVTEFGLNLFENPEVAEINTAAVPDDYILGPGDNIIINLWGRVQQEYNLTVDREGKVFIPKAGEITAWGMTLSDFEKHLDDVLKKVYTGYERRVTIGKIRTIKVFVYGEVRAPGGYAVSALSTLFNALYRAGGPNDNGSLRQIKLIRDSKTRLIDLYDFLIDGDKTCDLPLMSGDVIFVPLAGAQATIRGEVRRPAIYELVGNEKASDLIALAGGPTANAFLGRLMLDRIGDDDSRKVVDLDYTSGGNSDPALKDGDDLSVFSIYQMRQNIAWIMGAVKHPGTFERTDSMHVSDLIDHGQLLPNNVYTKRADLYRHRSDGQLEIIAVDLQGIINGDKNADINLADLDSLYIYSTDEVLPPKYVYIEGMVQNPGQYPLFESMTAGDLIFLAGNFQESAYTLRAELARIDEQGSTDLIELRLDQFDNGGDVKLHENDRLFVRKIPGYEVHRTVAIEGEVKFPGTYSLTHRDESFWELLQRAGGFTGKAFPTGTVFKRRAIAADLERKNIDKIIERSQPLLADSTGLLKPVQTMAFETDKVDRIIIDMEKLLTTNGNQGDFKLQAGDRIYVPEIPSGISVLGEVCSNGTIKFTPGQKVKYYLEQAGGFTKRADKKETRLVKANGAVYSSGSVLKQRADLGDIIIVPTEIKKEKDWFKIISASLSILTGIATTVLIVDRL